ncbi:MAG: hypothetical protein WC473_02905 [Patescibacteria group bacterium]
MQKLKQYWIIILLMVIVGGGLFYWFQWRPTQIRKDCSVKVMQINTNGGLDQAFEEFKQLEQDYDNNYKKCLRDNGIEK